MVHSHLYYHKGEIILLVSRDVLLCLVWYRAVKLQRLRFSARTVTLHHVCTPIAPHVLLYQLYVLHVPPDIYLRFCIG